VRETEPFFSADPNSVGMAECAVCCNTFNNATRKVIVCPQCDYSACESCQRNYVISKILTQSPSCMNCHAEYTEAFVWRNFTRSWRLGDLKRAKERVLEQQEQAMYDARYATFWDNSLIPLLNRHLTDAWHYISESKHPLRKDEKTNELHYVFSRTYLNRAISSLGHCRKWMGQMAEDDPLRLSAERAERWVKDLDENEERTERWARVRTHARRHAYAHYDILRRGSVERKKRTFVRPCTQEGCRGMLSTDGVCGKCCAAHCKTCMKLRSEEEEEHACDPEDVETVKLIVQTSRPCPCCHLYIHKSEGCSLMWCTQCHTTFDYTTGEVTKGRNHNPHYYEFLRQGGREPPREEGDDPTAHCALDEQSILRSLSRNKEWGSPEDRSVAFAICVLLMELEGGYHVRQRGWYTEGGATQAAHGEERARQSAFNSSMLGYLEGSAYRVELQRAQKHFSKCRAYRAIADTFTAVMRESVQDWVQTGCPPRANLLKKMQEVGSWCNAQFRETGMALQNDWPKIYWRHPHASAQEPDWCTGTRTGHLCSERCICDRGRMHMARAAPRRAEAGWVYLA